MTPSQLEAKVLGIVDRVVRGQPVEDSFVELKASWIEPKKAGRRLGGLCNAAHGEPVLWIIGLDEDRGVVGAAFEELADWWAQVQAEFDQQKPTVLLNISVAVSTQTVVALLVDSSRAPYVTKNPVPGQPVALEVPWREGNSTRSARREDLIRILVPAAKQPVLDLRAARASSWRDGNGQWRVKVSFEVYILTNQCMLLAHQCEFHIEPHQMDFRDRVYTREFEGKSVDGVAITPHDVVLSRPALVEFVAFGDMSGIGPVLPHSISAKLTVGFANAEVRPIIAVSLLQHRNTDQRVEYRWSHVPVHF